MDEEGEPCAKLCGNCANFMVLDDRPGDTCKWFGVCDEEFGEASMNGEVHKLNMTDWVYDHGRHGDDDCEKPDEWFEEG